MSLIPLTKAGKIAKWGAFIYDGGRYGNYIHMSTKVMLDGAKYEIHVGKKYTCMDLGMLICINEGLNKKWGTLVYITESDVPVEFQEVVDFMVNRLSQDTYWFGDEYSGVREETDITPDEWLGCVEVMMDYGLGEGRIVNCHTDPGKVHIVFDMWDNNMDPIEFLKEHASKQIEWVGLLPLE